MERPQIFTFSSVAYVVSLGLFLHLCLFTASTVVNLPIWDDFDIALRFVNRFKESDSVLDRIFLVLEQHNEHRIVITRALVLLSVGIFSSVNFPFLIACAIGGLAGLVLLLSVGGRFRAITLLVACAILLQPQYGDGLIWASTCVCSFWMCFLAIASGHVAFLRGPRFYLLFPVMGLACFTQGNGILLPFCISAVLILHREWRRAIGVTLCGGALVLAYFQNYMFLPHNKPMAEVLAAYPKVLEYGFVLVGNALGFSDADWSFFAGIFLTLGFLVLSFSKAGRANPALVVFASFLFLSVALNAATRGLSGIQYALSPGRYTILSAGILASLGILALLSCCRAWQRGVIVGLALVFNHFSWSLYRGPATELNVQAVNDFVRYLLFKNEGLTYPWPTTGIPIFQEALAKGTFKTEEAIEDLNLARQAEPPLGVPSASRKGFKKGISRVHVSQDYVLVEGWGFVKGCLSANTDVYVRLKGDNSQVSFLAAPKFRSDISDRFKSADRERAGYIVMFPRDLLEHSQRYSLNVQFVCDGSSTLHETPYTVVPSVFGRVELKKQKSAS